VFDIIAPDRVTSMLPPGLKLVLHVNPQSMQFTYAKTISRQQTMAGWVEYHWGSNPTEISFNMATGGFMRLYSGLSNITGPTASNDKLPKSMRAVNVQGTRRETIAYDKYLDLLSLFRNNGAIYDARGSIAFQGQILITYDGGSWWGWFSNFSVEENADKPYQFTLTTSFTVDRELHRVKSIYIPPESVRTPPPTGATEPDGAATDPSLARYTPQVRNAIQEAEARERASSATAQGDSLAWLPAPTQTRPNANQAIPPRPPTRGR
jgi:hypothetical protein